MIFYFSATGNSKYTAEMLADLTDDRAESIEPYIIERNFDLRLGKEEALVIVSPTYGRTVPMICRDFLVNLAVHGGNYYCFIATCGNNPGCSGFFANRYFTVHNQQFDAFFSVKMPNSWTPENDLSDKDAIDGINRLADGEIVKIADKINKRVPQPKMEKALPAVFSHFINENYKSYNNPLAFTVDSEICNSCNTCAENCPSHIIDIFRDHPIWTYMECNMCMRCLHNCPQFAIQLGPNTKDHGQYSHPAYVPKSHKTDSGTKESGSVDTPSDKQEE